MPKSGSVAVEPEQIQESRPAQPRRRQKPSEKPKTQPPYAVVLHNDPINDFGFVIGVLQKVFHYNSGKAFMLTVRAHVTGRSIVWTGALEVAELKADQVRACGADPTKRAQGGQPLSVSIEPLPD